MDAIKYVFTVNNNLSIAELDRVIKLMRKSKHYLSNGKGRLSKLFKTQPEYIVAAKSIINGKYELPYYGELHGTNMDWVGFSKLHSSLGSIPVIPKVEPVVLKARKVLVFDIETAPMLGHMWGLWKQNIQTDAIVNDWFIITWAAKWLGGDKVITSTVTSEEALREDDKRVTKELWNLLDEADIVISYNGRKFDHKKANLRFIVNGLPPTSPYHTLDVMQSLKGVAASTSNKLDYWNKQLKITRKLDNEGLQLWIKAIRGYPKALEDMTRYCAVDTLALEELYLKTRHWFKNHPIIYKDNNTCPICGGTKFETLSSFGNVYQYPIYRCLDCLSIIKNKKSNGTNNNLRSF
jgi:hypothetical protein